MEYLWPPHQIHLYTLVPLQQGASNHVPDKRLSILWVPVILVIAVLCIPLPFPTGLPLVALALSLLLNQSRRARVIYVRTKRKLRPDTKLHRGFDAIDKLLRVKRRRTAGRQVENR